MNMATYDINDKHKKYKPYAKLMRRLQKNYYSIVQTIENFKIAGTTVHIEPYKLKRKRDKVLNNIQSIEDFQKGDL